MPGRAVPRPPQRPHRHTARLTTGCRGRARRRRYHRPIGVPPPDPARDRELVAAARGGDRVALDALLRSHQPRLYAVCRRLLGDDADALDATQDALIAIVRGLPRFDGRSAFSTWAYRIATNAALDELRRRRRRPEPTDTLPETAPARRLDDAVADRLSLDDALAHIPADFRVAVVLRDVADLDYAEIAAVLDLPPGTVRSRIARGRAALAARLGNQPTEPGRPTPDP